MNLPTSRSRSTHFKLNVGRNDKQHNEHYDRTLNASLLLDLTIRNAAPDHNEKN